MKSVAFFIAAVAIIALHGPTWAWVLFAAFCLLAMHAESRRA